MVSLSFTAAVRTFVLLLAVNGARASPGFKSSAWPRSGYNPCPERCAISGPKQGNWSVYPDFRQIKKCKEAMFYSFGLYDPVDDRDMKHKIHACSSFGPDFSTIPASNVRVASGEAIDVEFEVGWWQEGFGLATSGLRSLVKQIRQYADNGHGATDRPFIIYGQSGQATIGLYIGQGLLNQGLSQSALKMFQDNLGNFTDTSPSLAMQLCEKNYDSAHIFGIVGSSDGQFTSIQNRLQSWANGTCLSFEESTRLPGSATFTTPPIQSNRTVSSAEVSPTSVATKLGARAECRTIQAEFGTACPELAVMCGISAADFTKYNPGSTFCSDGSPSSTFAVPREPFPISALTKTMMVHAFQYSITKEEIQEFNKNTWGWSNCDPLFAKSIICLSKGTPPFPAEIANAQCGPQKPGSKSPTDGSNITDLNPCPLNACCNIWGQCGITNDFCIDTNTGAPGTAKKDTFGCISNCGTDIDALQIDSSKFTHIHFGFGTLTPSFDVETGDIRSTYNFGEFKKIKDAKRMLSFGGWDFSTMPDTYQIFRDGVKPANRLSMAQKIAAFIKDNDLDGVDIDWEYPGAPDLPDFDPGTEEDGPNYLAFLAVLKNLLPGKTVSIAAPASYWYLKQFPIAQIGKLVDYIVFMTYDLHGQWDANNGYSQEGCDDGNCLRSQVNLTETKQSLAMITKAGVPRNKVIVGVTSYGRSFKMAEEGCYGPNCAFVGDRLNSQAKPGRCTDTAGYISDAEIKEILNSPKRAVTESFVDPSSNSDILIYDGTEYVSYMGSAIKATRATLYSSWGLGGLTDWATDLQDYNDPPLPAKSWDDVFKLIDNGENPKADHTRTGNWTDLDCMHEMIVDANQYTPSEKDTDKKNGITFIDSAAQTLTMVEGANCGSLLEDSCVVQPCPAGANGPTSGPAAMLIWNSLVQLHLIFRDYHRLIGEAEVEGALSLQDLENKFAPIPPEGDNTWKLLLIDLLTVGTLGTAGPIFNTVIKRLPYFLEKPSHLDNYKDTTMNMIGQGTTVAKDLIDSPRSPWTPESQAEFSNYMAQVVTGWKNMTSWSLGEDFSGKDDSIERLGKLISNGKLGKGKSVLSSDEPDDKQDYNSLVASIKKCFFGFTIPALWQASKSYPFVMGAGHDCGSKEITDYLTEDNMDATGSCVDGKQYYLVYPKGDSDDCKVICYDKGPCQTQCTNAKFSPLPGLSYLNGTSYGGISKDDLIKGSVRTWIKNGKENGGKTPDPTDEETIDNMMNADVTTPGYVRIPVCSPERAYKSWDTTKAGSSANYPCDIPPGKNTCGDSTFENDTTDGSPLADDCLVIIKNWEGDGGTSWKPLVPGKPHRELGSYGTCAIGVEATKVDGNADFTVGGQDAIDLINESIKRFKWEGKVGASGTMKCDGTIKQQSVLWGIYHT
ncbi:uncharacterized protein N7515_001056 [Penicillium bovifimosum]|uniref:chitinase n=1 Tax=Penicillium bovifimosum TaxID=126998 RepID=A0A9W9HJE0_9EURO|nr:uncharacterized protein N7515_001056 [Penicillium bovifimosum]KAJ5146492.1 hypothetical protein N7515_001056 [Penicillium bovifimosum]